MDVVASVVVWRFYEIKDVLVVGLAGGAVCRNLLVGLEGGELALAAEHKDKLADAGQFIR